MKPFIAVTDKAWFDFLATRARNGLVDEVNFWSPRATRPMKRMEPGEPVMLRLKHPHNAIAGYGFFAHFCALELDRAWDLFDWKNGDEDKLHFLERIGRYRGVSLIDPRVPRDPLGCTLLRSVIFWPERRWLPWGEEMAGRRISFRANQRTTHCAASFGANWDAVIDIARDRSWLAARVLAIYDAHLLLVDASDADRKNFADVTTLLNRFGKSEDAADVLKLVGSLGDLSISTISFA